MRRMLGESQRGEYARKVIAETKRWRPCFQRQHARSERASIPSNKWEAEVLRDQHWRSWNPVRDHTRGNSGKDAPRQPSFFNRAAHDGSRKRGWNLCNVYTGIRCQPEAVT